MQESKPPPSTYAKRLLLSSLSAVVAETSTFPIDIVKTRLQLHNSTTTAFRVALDIWRREGRCGDGGSRGVSGFYKGLPPAILRHLLYTPVRIVGYEYLKGRSGGSNGSSAPADDSLFRKAICGGVSGVVAQVIASPADLVKVRMQADGRLLSQGLEPRYVGIVDAFKKIIRIEGINGLWRGVLPNAQRAFLVNMGELACYDHAKHFIINNEIAEDGVFAHTLASIVSGLSATTLSCPADVIKTRMMSQAAAKDTKAVYRHSYDCLVNTVRLEGILALWKGFFPTWARLGPWQFVFWVSYEKFRYVTGLSSF